MNSIVLFDGDCHFCDKSVQFILKYDRHKHFYFTSLSSHTGRMLLEKYHLPADMNSIVLIENDRVFVKSSAVLQICRQLQGGWQFFYVFKLVPRSIRDGCYEIIARNRYRWFGRKKSCQLLSKEDRKRFL